MRALPRPAPALALALVEDRLGLRALESIASHLYPHLCWNIEGSILETYILIQPHKTALGFSC